ncbi:thymidine kinase [Marivirga sp.]|uniref:thymidine kinase n=1 Tax=Marivirga sp. TaxID=2018662 RepID=UPI002D7EDBAC|nr:thymidine kinase [Marivirga sp.]HET8860212.1 thymidine kinase [Marivirga sp.]
MFVEPHIGREEGGKGKGWIELICGSMFSGKTEELIRRLNRALIAKQKIEIFKPKIDTRYDESEVVSHNKTKIRSTPVDFAEDILLFSGNSEVVGIDEAQFFDSEIVNVVNTLANQGKRVIIAGLDMDFSGKAFGSMPELMATAEYVTKVHAICVKCGGIASYSYRLSENKQKVILGEKDKYEPRCRKCFNAP